MVPKHLHTTENHLLQCCSFWLGFFGRLLEVCVCGGGGFGIFFGKFAKLNQLSIKSDWLIFSHMIGF